MRLYIINMEIKFELKEVIIKNRTCYYFDNKIKLEGFDLDNTLIDERSYKNYLVYNIHSELWLVINRCILGLMK